LPAFLAALFAAYLIVFAFFSRTFFHTRHLLSTELWYVAIMGLGLYALWIFLRAGLRSRGRLSGFLLAAAIGFAFANPTQIALPSTSSSPDMSISEDYHHDMSTVQGYLVEHVQPNDSLISTVYGLYATWEGVPAFGFQYRITSETSLDKILEIVREHPAGWIVIDKIRLDLSALSVKDFNRGSQIEYIGTFGDEYVWRWQESGAVLVKPLGGD
jgi:hypothetical protein